MLRKQRFLIALTILVMASLTCALPNSTGSKSTPSSNQAPKDAPKSNSSSIPSNPIGLRRGLAGLNGYRLTIRSINNGPTSQDKNQLTITEESGSDKKSSHVQYETVSSSQDNPTEKTSSSDRYTIGNHQCSFSSDNSEAAVSDMDPMAKELLNTWYSLIEFVPIVDEPVFIGEEEVNGVRTNHFKFKAKGLGVDSVTEAISSDGEYWLAQDGQYIVKYSVVIETRIGPAGDANTKTMHSEFYIELKDINQPITIALPQTCKEAASASPTPSNQNAQAPTEIPTVIPAVIPTTAPNPPAQASSVGGFAGFWDTNYGDMTCTVDGEKVNCEYTHNAGKIEAFLNPDGKSLEGSWFEAPTYKPANHAGRMVMTISADGNSFTGQWWYGPAGEGGTWAGTRKTGPASTNSGSALFEDDFSNVNSGWPTYMTADASCNYSDNGFRIKVIKAASLLWATPDQTLQNDISLHVDATKAGGTDVNSFGLVCRYQDGNNFYYFAITSDGYGGIAKRKDGKDIWLTGDDLLPSAAVKQGSATNRISADCMGNTLTLYANGQQIASVTDSSYSGGDVGLIVGSYETDGVDILFDNFIVFKAEN